LDDDTECDTKSTPGEAEDGKSTDVRTQVDETADAELKEDTRSLEQMQTVENGNNSVANGPKEKIFGSELTEEKDRNPSVGPNG